MLFPVLRVVAARVFLLTSQGWRGKGVVVKLLVPTLLTGVVLCDVIHTVGELTFWPVVAMEPATRVQAPDEYRRNPQLKKEDIKELREWLATEKHLPTAVADEMLIIFHHSCYYDLEQTKRCIESYYTMRTQAPEFFTNRDVTSPELARSLEALNLSPLPVPDPETGYRIMYHGLQSFDSSKYVFCDAVKLTFMMFDAFAHEYGTTPGFAVLFDMEGTKIGHLLRVSLSALRKYINYMQEASPIRLKAIHMVNANSLVDKALFLAKPFMKKELIDLIHIHKAGSETLYQHIPKQCLPREFGGTLESKDVYYAAHLKTLARLASFFKDEEKLRVDETLREKKKKNNKKQKPESAAETDH